MFGRHFRPAVSAGGSARSMTNLVDRLSDEIDFWVVCRDRDLDSDKPFDLHLNQWTECGNCHAHYTTTSLHIVLTFARILGSQRWDAVYVNSYVSPIYSVVVRFLHRFTSANRVPIIIAPRGEFAESALAISPIKKKLLLAIGKLVGMHEDVVLQASCEHEKQDILRVLSPRPEQVMIAPDLLPANAVGAQLRTDRKKIQGVLRLALVARIAPIKNIAFAIDVLSRCQSQISLDIYGPIEDQDYWEECKKKISTLPDNVTIVDHGVVSRETLTVVLGQADAFILTTLGENFGHSIFEALAEGCPVIISDQTPWRNLSTVQAGYDLPLSDRASFVEAIEHLAALDEEQFSSWRECARQFAKEWLESSDSSELNRKLFRVALEKE